MLFTFPSRYCSTIGHQVVFRLGGWSPRLPTRFLVSGGTLDSATSDSVFAYEALTLYCRPSHAVLLTYPSKKLSSTPNILLRPVWPLPLSLATTRGISVDVSSSSYLDVSVQTVPHLHLFYSMQVSTVLPWRVSPFGYLRIKAYLRLPEAFRSLSRPSSAPDAKAFPLRSF